MDIQNFIFFDTETTGLPYQEYNKTRITELTLIAIQSNHISLGVYPRVQNKLTLCFNPQKLINPEAAEITRMSNDLLEYQSTFNKKACILINDFLALQRKPICFVAHNGNYFDYPILKAEFAQAGCELLDDILCIDSLQTFRDLNIYKSEKSSDENAVIIKSKSNIKSTDIETNIYELPTQKVPIEFCDGYDEILYNAVEGIERACFDAKKIQNINENTPKKKNSIFTSRSNNEHNVQQDKLYYMPFTSKENKDITDSSSSNGGVKHATKPPVLRKKLDFGNSYKLIDVYKRLTKKVNENAHMSEEDVNMLIECTATLGQRFVDWANANAKKLSNIPTMTPGKRIGT